MSSPSRNEFDGLASLIDNLKDVARLQQLVETLAANQRDVTESLAEHRELFAERWASLGDLSRRLDAIERSSTETQSKIERRAAEVVDEVAKSASKLLDRVNKIEQDLAPSGQVSERFRAEFARAVSDFQAKVEELHRRIADRPGVDTTAPVALPGVVNMKYGKVSVTAANYLVVLFFISVAIGALSPVGQRLLNKYLSTEVLKSELPKTEKGERIDASKTDAKDKGKGVAP